MGLLCDPIGGGIKEKTLTGAWAPVRTFFAQPDFKAGL